MTYSSYIDTALPTDKPIKTGPDLIDDLINGSSNEEEEKPSTKAKSRREDSSRPVQRGQ